MFSVHFSVLIMGWLRAESLWAPIRKLSSRARTSAARTSPDFVMSEWAPFCERSADFGHCVHILAIFFMWENCSAPAGFQSHCCRLTRSGRFPWLWLKKRCEKVKRCSTRCKTRSGTPSTSSQLRRTEFLQRKANWRWEPPISLGYFGHILVIYWAYLWYIGSDKQSCCKEKQTEGEI